VLIVPGFFNDSIAQTTSLSDSITVFLSNEGFENVRTKIDGSDLMIAFENRLYRSQARGLAEVLKAISHSANIGADTRISLVVLYQEVPMLLVTVGFDAYQKFVNDLADSVPFIDYLNVTMDYNPIWEKISGLTSSNQSKFKSDVSVIPQFRGQFGDFNYPIRANINLIPEYNLLIARGLSFKAQMIVPVYNDFNKARLAYHDLDEEGSMIRPGLISLSQFLRLDDEVFFTATAGFFDKNRAGANFEMKKYFANGKISLGANVGYTTDYTYTGVKTDYLVDENYLTAFLSAEYRYEPYDLVGGLNVGKYLYNEMGVRMDLMRQFREVNVGFFVLATESELNGGFNFSIPIPPRKYSKPKYFRVRPSEKFSWEYRAKGLPTTGTMYNTENELFRIMIEFNPDYIKRNLLLDIKKYN
jgi:hypothetical protein